MALSCVFAFLGGLALSLELPLLPTNSAFLFGLMDLVGCVPGLSPFPCCPLILSSELELCEGGGDLCSGLLCVSYSVTKVHPALVCTILHSESVHSLRRCSNRLSHTGQCERDGGTSDITGAVVVLAITKAQNLSCERAGQVEE
ncbi:Protein AMAC1 [Myotis brandtii]|uniref:Protein AMAC1 n=1 Tax=Myotis brandtii TaxID=109478 RepID=S7Q3H6_MYOBR|nr:Protein AMAC1 [Myotis brandtii]